MSARARLLGACVAAVIALALGVVAAWPIYESRWLLVPAAAAAVIGGGTAVLAWRLRWPGWAAAALLFVGFVLSVGPVAVPQGAARAQFGVLQAAVDGVAAVVLGWKQLLTIALPVGSYQSLLVPAYVVFLLTAFLTVRLAARGGRFAPAAALPLLAPVAFGTIFGSSALSAPLSFGPLVLSAPREVGLWGAAVLLASVWIRFSAGAERRAALRLARQDGAASTRGSARRALLGIAVLTLCAAVALAAAPPMVAAAGPGHRVVLRDRIDPELFVREQVSPLAAYRASKSDAAFSATMFEVRSSGALPARLRLAVLDAYDGVDFHVGRADADRFARLPSAVPLASAADVEVRVGPGYTGIWAPTAALGGVPEFTGPRAGELTDAFFVNRSTGAAIALPGGRAGAGLDAGDGYRAPMSTAPDGSLAGPAGTGAEFDPESMPELARWLEAQAQPATGAGVVELVRRLRERGYLSHALAQSPGAPAAWLARLRAGQSFAFVPSTGGHSISRLEQLFSDLNAQERRAGPRARPEQLVAAVGDDEQFAAAAALIARAQGFASRVVLGFRLGGAGAGVDGVPACGGPVVCTGEHLAAWIEVRDASGVWVPLDVSPQTRLAPQALEQGEQSPPFPTVPEMRDAEQVDPPTGGGDPSDAAEPREDPVAQASLWSFLAAAGLSVAALALLALPFLFLPVAKRLRRRRRRSEPEPEVRALGAWQEVRDYAVDAGADLPRQAGCARAARELGSDAARWVAAQVEVAVFSPGGIDSRTADRVWEAADAENRVRRAELSRWRRVRAAYSLRSYGIGFAARSRSARESAAPRPKRGARRSVQTQGEGQNVTATATGVLLIPLLIITLLLGLVLLIWKLWAFGSLFPRLGLRAAEGWVPILNQARLNRRGGLPGWLSLGRLALLIALIGRAAVGVADPGAALPAAHLLDLVCWALVAVVCIGRVVEIVAMHRISAEAGRGAGFTVLAALLTPIWAMLLARGIGRGRVLGDAEAVEPRFEAPPFSASVEAAETHAVPTLGIAGVRRSGAGPVNPLGSATEAEYERLAAESFLEPPAAPLGSAAVAEPFSWTAARRPLDDERAGAGSPPPAIPPVPAVSSPPPDLAPSPAVSKPTGITGAFPPLRPGEVRRPEPRIERGGDPDRTIIVSPPAGSGWSLRLPDGRVLPITAADTVIGRRPEARDDAAVLAIADPTRTLSKSHVRLRLDGERATVEDLGSTNGLFLVHAEGHEEPVPPGRAVPATARMVFGTLEVELLRDGEAT